MNVDFGDDEEPLDARCTSACCTVQDQRAVGMEMGNGKEKQ